MSICKLITRSLGTLIILWSAVACAAQSLDVTNVSAASDVGAGSNEGAAVSTIENGPASQVATADPGVGTAPTSESGAAVSSDAPAKGSSEGVKVHGHWTIEVRNPDGTLVNHREVDNAFNTIQGAETLSKVLGRVITPGRWTITLGSGSPNEICENPVGTPSINCFIQESSDGASQSNSFKTLVVTVTGSPNTLKISGSMTAARDGLINDISSFMSFCLGTISPATCRDSLPDGEGSLNFTNTSLTTPIVVLADQQVQVSVVFTFS